MVFQNLEENLYKFKKNFTGNRFQLKIKEIKIDLQETS